MKRIVTGILAHVDAGKTTCIESMLYEAGQIKKMGRVDHQNTFLDYDSQERNRGITIYSKQAYYPWKDNEIYLIDTPGHIDFSSEMERSLQVLDLAILLINAQDGVQSHTETIWKCLKHYKVPTIVFINKMDISHHSKEELMNDLTKHCSSNCIDFSSDDAFEKLALVNEELLNTYLETNTIPDSLIQQAVYSRECFPCFFGSALHNQGIQELMDAISKFSLEKEYPLDFGAKVYKISSDDQGNVLTHVKITGGILKPKQKISDDQKVDQIRLYSGQSYSMLQEAYPGMICALKGLSGYQPGQGLGFEKDSESPILNAYMNYQLLLPDGVDALEMIKYCKVFAQEDPNLQIHFDSKSQQIFVRIMGAVQMEILQKQIEQKSNIKVGFGMGQVLYKETISEPVIGVGHFEPLRHYAEVHLKLEPLPRNSGLQFECKIPTSELSINWQRLILTHLQEKEHIGVLTGSPITDMKMSLVAGKAHLKHTEGGDFRQATYRAVRHGLKKANSILLEPYYKFSLTVPSSNVSKALYDLETRHAQFEVHDSNDERILITGVGPVKELIDYPIQVVSYTKGKGKFTCALDGYYPCHDFESVINDFNYDSERDLENPTGSVFCEHGSGYTVPFDEVEDHMHIAFKQENSTNYSQVKYTINEEEAKRIFEMAGGKNKNEKKIVKPPKKKVDLTQEKISIQNKLQECLIVDGYNMIFSWESLSNIARYDISLAREELISLIVNYQAFKGYKVILVFDGYRVKENKGSSFKKENTSIIYTKVGQTADSYIEKTVHDLRKTHRCIVATSDGLIQNAILANGATRMSSRELEVRVLNTNKQALNHLK